MVNATGGRRRVVIVGAGPAGISTALHLTDPRLNPDWRARYSVDIYQLGWRAGGKGATGRNAQACERIEEHGIHLFGNMYYNATRMVRAALEEVEFDPHDRYRTMEEILLPSTASSGTDYVDGRWQQVLSPLISTPGCPWEGDVSIQPADMVGALLERTVAILAWATDHFPPPGHGVWTRVEGLFEHGAAHELRRWAARIQRHLDRERGQPNEPSGSSHDEVVGDLTELASLALHLSESAPAVVSLRAIAIEFDLVATLFRGLLADDVLARGINAIDDENYRDWFARHGASATTLASSWPQAIPNTALSYDYGDTTAIPAMSAACYVMFYTRWVMGTGDGGYLFRQGTGETIVKPLYRLLVQRGVRVHFFHKLTAVEPAQGADKIARLVFDVQATPLEEPYDPLRRLPDGELVWPNRPLYERLVEGEALRRGDELAGGGYDLESWWTAWEPAGRLVLEVDRDFDEVVLATPISTLEHTCPSLIGRSSAWRDMVANLRTAATQAIQIWTDRTTGALGWDGPLTGTDRYLGGVYGQDLTSYCDFSDLVDQERWPEGRKPAGLVYFIGALADPDEIPPFSDHGYPGRMRERVHWTSVQFLRTIDGLLPGAATSPIDGRSFDFSMLVPHDPAAEASRGVNRFEQQYWRANIDPNERYTLSLPGTVGYRLDAWDSKFTNLVLAGDWINTGWNVGSFEGATMAGKLASLAISGAPALDEVWGYDFLEPVVPTPPPPRVPRT